MIFSPVVFNNLVIGEAIEDRNNLFFFGNKNSNPAVLERAYPDLNFYRLQQTHSTNVVTATRPAPQADAHFSREIGAALCISTADCIPILGVHDKTVFAIHAGWRGVLGDILGQTLSAVSCTSPIQLFCGPHIQVESFEVDLALANEFMKTWQKKYKFTGSQDLVVSNITPTKAHLNLAKLLEIRLSVLDIAHKTIWTSKVDTKTNLEYASYRREKDARGRNISFVARRR